MPHQQLFRDIFKTGLQDYGTGNQLQKIAEDHPWFSPVHFFRLKRDGITNEHTAALANLHFNNPFLLNYQLNREAGEETAVPGPIHFPEAVNEEPVTATKNETFTETEQIAEETAFVPPASSPQQAQMTVEEDIPVVPGAVQHFFATHPVAEKTTTEITAVKIEPSLPAKKTMAEENTVPPPAAAENQPAVPEASAGKLPQEWLFEPLHTTDYFASQGIKLSEEVQITDKLGKQLKSFTEWLKTMKKVHDNRQSADAPLDVSVQNMAEKSNVEQEILTETMAEAFLQQGKRDKAIETYQKLSLLNPAKSAFFAAKIENLKGE
ncbi:MAG: hypothetical protein WAT19_11350 [Ferruginibacter sp.]